jgi:hypothetical protein
MVGVGTAGAAFPKALRGAIHTRRANRLHTITSSMLHKFVSVIHYLFFVLHDAKKTKNNDKMGVLQKFTNIVVCFDVVLFVWECIGNSAVHRGQKNTAPFDGRSRKQHRHGDAF